jgi:hypothetical protein
MHITINKKEIAILEIVAMLVFVGTVAWLIIRR